jgi:hypothetical protein
MVENEATTTTTTTTTTTRRIKIALACALRLHVRDPVNQTDRQKTDRQTDVSGFRQCRSRHRIASHRINMLATSEDREEKLRCVSPPFIYPALDNGSFGSPQHALKYDMFSTE